MWDNHTKYIFHFLSMHFKCFILNIPKWKGNCLFFWYCIETSRIYPLKVICSLCHLKKRELAYWLALTLKSVLHKPSGSPRKLLHFIKFWVFFCFKKHWYLYKGHTGLGNVSDIKFLKAPWSLYSNISVSFPQTLMPHLEQGNIWTRTTGFSFPFLI